jgi:uncharacterized membrane protein YesL
MYRSILGKLQNSNERNQRTTQMNIYIYLCIYTYTYMYIIHEQEDSISQYFKLSVLHKLIYRFNAILVKILCAISWVSITCS